MINKNLHNVCSALNDWCNSNNVAYDIVCDESDLQGMMLFKTNKLNSLIRHLKPIMSEEGIYVRRMKVRGGNILAFSLKALSESSVNELVIKAGMELLPMSFKNRIEDAFSNTPADKPEEIAEEEPQDLDLEQLYETAKKMAAEDQYKDPTIARGVGKPTMQRAAVNPLLHMDIDKGGTPSGDDEDEGDENIGESYARMDAEAREDEILARTGERTGTLDPENSSDATREKNRKEYAKKYPKHAKTAHEDEGEVEDQYKDGTRRRRMGLRRTSVNATESRHRSKPNPDNPKAPPLNLGGIDGISTYSLLLQAQKGNRGSQTMLTRNGYEWEGVDLRMYTPAEGLELGLSRESVRDFDQALNEALDDMATPTDDQPGDLFGKFAKAINALATELQIDVKGMLEQQGIKAKESDDGLRIILYTISADTNAPVPIHQIDSSLLADKHQFSEKLKEVIDLAKGQAPGTDKQKQEMMRNQDTAIKDVADAVVPDEEYESPLEQSLKDDLGGMQPISSIDMEEE